MNIFLLTCAAVVNLALAWWNESTCDLRLPGGWHLPNAAALQQHGVPLWLLPSPGSDHQDALKFGLYLRSMATPEERQVLMTLVSGSQKWDASAAELLTDVLHREPGSVDPKVRMNQQGQTADRRLWKLTIETGEHCQRNQNQAACVADVDDRCTPCVWLDYDDLDCQPARCDQYHNEADCCANPNNVVTGCDWGQAKDAWSPGCREFRCSHFESDQGACSANPNCKWMGRGGSCECIDAGSVCKDGNEDNPERYSDPECPTIDCTACLKNGGETDAKIDWDMHRDDVCSAIKAERTNICNDRCSDAVHCDGEVECALWRVKGKDPCLKYVCPPVVFPSCAAARTTSITTTTMPLIQSCEASCADIDDFCAAHSCGSEACPYDYTWVIIAVVSLVVSICGCCLCIFACYKCECCCFKKTKVDLCVNSAAADTMAVGAVPVGQPMIPGGKGPGMP